jgi:hypothetical protein
LLGTLHRQIAIDVKGETGEPLLRAELSFEVRKLAKLS